MTSVHLQAQDRAMHTKPQLEAGEAEALARIAGRIPRPDLGLPEPVFEFALATVPTLNVDLFVTDAQGRFLMAWREDPFADGWHIPGGIVRRGETLAQRIQETARLELGMAVEAEPAPAAVAELFGDRGHFVSMIHRCRLAGDDSAFPNGGHAPLAPGQVAWFTALPERLYPTHRVYAGLLAGLKDGASDRSPAMACQRLSERAAAGR